MLYAFPPEGTSVEVRFLRISVFPRSSIELTAEATGGPGRAFRSLQVDQERQDPDPDHYAFTPLLQRSTASSSTLVANVSTNRRSCEIVAWTVNAVPSESTVMTGW